MNLQVTELKIGNVQAATIEWNGAEIKASLDVALEDYRNMVVTEETLKGSKKVMAELNKQAKVLDDFRKATVKKLNPDIKTFEAEAKELVKMIKEARTVINDQVETFIIKQREEKKANVKCRIDALQHEFELEEEFFCIIELKDQYLNSSMTLNKAEQDLRVQFEQAKQLQNLKQQKRDTIKVIVDAFNDKLTFKFTSNEFDYLLDQDIATISSVVNEKVQGRLKEQEAELERIRLEQEAELEKAKKEAAEKVEREAKAEAARIEKEHQEQLRKIEIAKQEEIQKIEAEKQETIFAVQDAVQKFDSIVPDESKVGLQGEDNPVREFNFSVLATTEQIEALRCYLEQYDFTYCVEEV